MALNRPTSLSELAGHGFVQLEDALRNLEELVSLVGDSGRPVLAFVSKTQNPDQALELLIRLARSHKSETKAVLSKHDAAERLCLVLGASSALYEFIERTPGVLKLFTSKPTLPNLDEMRKSLAQAATSTDEIRKSYRIQLLQITIFDLTRPEPMSQIQDIAAALADLAGVTLDAGLVLAGQELVRPEANQTITAEELSNTRITVIGMGKCGARELNYISDVDVIYVAESASDSLEQSRALEIATKLATSMMRIMDSAATEPSLWQVDANLRPEGKAGALVRSLESHVAYYERWAKSWEFQALLKARPIAGNMQLGERYLAALEKKVWDSATRENFVESVQAMRERVTEHIPSDEVGRQIKLGPGGLRDIEFTVQLLQLVHGRTDITLRVRDTIGALEALSSGGYINREDAGKFAQHYRFLRFLEHRIQLTQLRRTHLMPVDEAGQRTIARAVKINMTSSMLISQWEQVKLEVRTLHQQLFYRPLLSAVSGLSSEDLELTSSQAQDRLFAIGFQDPKSALTHITSLTAGLSRRAAIQRQLLPVLLQWFAEGSDPDAALLAFRRLSEDLGDSHWYLKMLRDSSGAAKRMTQVFSNSRLATNLFEKIPEAAAWFDRSEELTPLGFDEIESEMLAFLDRHEDSETVANALRLIRKRETLRIAVGAVLGITDLEQISSGISALTEAYLKTTLGLATRNLERETGGQLKHDLAIVAMGRFGGAEMGFGSDADVMFVYSPKEEVDVNLAQSEAEKLVSEIRRLSSDQAFEFELDLDLRPEGKNGPIVRSLESYATYYKRWAGTWESQALLRARVIAGAKGITKDFVTLINNYRYPKQIDPKAIVEIRRIKARVEIERLPLGADPKRHLKLGRGSISDVEWLVQLFQLKFAHVHKEIQTPHTLEALTAMESVGLLSSSDQLVLREAWSIASRVRSAAMLYSNRRIEVLPVDRKQLEGIARLMEYPRGAASSLEQDYLAATRRGRVVFEKLFFD